MHEGDLAKLSPPDFEVLVRDLAQRIYGRPFESFGQGTDRGIDVRTRDDGPLTIIQCKRYSDTPHSSLEAAVRGEKDKITELAPAIYVVAHSRRATPGNVATLQGIIKDWAPQTDVWSAHYLLKLLNENDDIVKRHPKLWLTSAAVLSKIVHGATYTRSSEFLEQARDDLATFAPNEIHAKAHELLERNNIVVLTGDPGVGKTAIARNVALTYAAEGFEVVAVTRDIEEALNILKTDAPQLFIYDDFLGQSKLTDILSRNEASDLSLFCSAVRRSPNARLILTTRGYILQAARAEEAVLESLSKQLDEVVVSVDQYNRTTRAHILYNHLYWSSISNEALQVFVNQGTHWAVLRHRYYNPRLISQIVAILAEGGYAPTDFPGKFVEALDDPTALWERLFYSELRSKEHALLAALLTCNDRSLSSVHARWQQILRNYDPGVTVTQLSLQSSLRVLEPTFVRIRRTYATQHIEFANPGVEDILSSLLTSMVDLIQVALRELQEWDDFIKLDDWSSPYGLAGHLLDVSSYTDTLDSVLREMMTRSEHPGDPAGVVAACRVCSRARVDLSSIGVLRETLVGFGNSLSLDSVCDFINSLPRARVLDQIARELSEEAIAEVELEELRCEDLVALSALAESYPRLVEAYLDKEELRSQAEGVGEDALSSVSEEGLVVDIDELINAVDFFGGALSEEAIDHAREILSYEPDEDWLRERYSAREVPTEDDVDRLFHSLVDHRRDS